MRNFQTSFLNVIKTTDGSKKSNTLYISISKVFRKLQY